jgi:hypothetical protein
MDDEDEEGDYDELEVSEATREKAKQTKMFIEQQYMTLRKASEERSARRTEAERVAQGLSEGDAKKYLEEQSKKESEYLRLRRQKLSIRHFQSIAIIGRGAFGEVRVAPSHRSRLGPALSAIIGHSTGRTRRARARLGLLHLNNPPRKLLSLTLFLRIPSLFLVSIAPFSLSLCRCGL